MSDEAPSLVTVRRSRSGCTMWVLLRDGRRIDSFLGRGRANRKAADLNREAALAEPLWRGLDGGDDD